ncbi:MAG: hypothetical protein IKI77_10760 [Oscillospiraceae bacterium]|nr:hypothetical protein [Oscillospiraceae bacterium]
MLVAFECHICMSDLCMSRLDVGFMYVRLNVFKEVSASRMRFRMGQAAPFRKGGFSQALFFPKLNAGGISLSAESDEGAALDLQAFEKA